METLDFTAQEQPDEDGTLSDDALAQIADALFVELDGDEEAAGQA